MGADQLPGAAMDLDNPRWVTGPSLSRVGVLERAHV